MEHQPRDYVTVADEQGQEKEYAIEALFDMEGQSYALLSAEEETVLMRVEEDEDEDEKYLIGISDPDERDAVLDAYQIAVDAAPAE